MKKINTLFLMVFLIVGTLGFVVADEDFEEYELPEAQEIGFFENMFDNMGLAFTFNREKKIQKALGLAEKRLAEAEALAEDDPEAGERAQERYDEFVAKAEEALEDISEANAENGNLSIGEMGKMARIQNQFEKHREHTARIYTRALERFEENNASDEKIERFESFYGRSSERSDEMEDRIIQRKESAMTKYKVLAEKSDEELEEIFADIEEGEGLTEAREQRTERSEVRVQNVMEIKNRNIEKAQVHLNDADLTDEERLEINNRIANAIQNAIQFELRARERIEAHKNLPITTESMLGNESPGNSNN